MKKLIAVLLIVLSFGLKARADEGMWLPLLLQSLNEKEMQSMGCKLTAEDIYSINHGSMKDAIVLFGRGCTAELVSDEGLMLTNHHCGYGQIQSHSTVEHDYLTDGFWAMDRSEELSNPGLTVTFLVRMEEVTNQVLEGVLENMTEKTRSEIIKVNIDSLNARAVRDSHYTSLVKPFFQQSHEHLKREGMADESCAFYTQHPVYKRQD